MVSMDAADKNREFAESLDAKLTLLSDPSGDVADAFGVAGLGGLFAKRWTFYIDRGGNIVHIDKDVQVDTAGQDIAKKLETLGFPKKAAAGDAPREPAGDAGGASR